MFFVDSALKCKAQQDLTASLTFFVAPRGEKAAFGVLVVHRGKSTATPA